MSVVAQRSPGVYLRALESESPRPARTAVTAFVGVAERGPLNRPQRVSSFGEFEEVFGRFASYGTLAPSIYAFFLNGGSEACIVRVGREEASSLSSTALGVLSSARSVEDALDTLGTPALSFRARSPGSWGNQIELSVSVDQSQELELARLAAPVNAGSDEIIVDALYDFRIPAADGSAPRATQIRLAQPGNLASSSVHQVLEIGVEQSLLRVQPPLPFAYPKGASVFGYGFRLDISATDRRESFARLSMNPAHARYIAGRVNGPERMPDLELTRAGHSLLVSVQAPELSAARHGLTPAPREVVFAGGSDGATPASGVLVDAGEFGTLWVTARASGRVGNRLRVRCEPFQGKLALPAPRASEGAPSRLVLEDIRGWGVGDAVQIGNDEATVEQVFEGEHALLLDRSLGEDHALRAVVAVPDRFTLLFDAEAPERHEAFFNLSLTGARSCVDLVNDEEHGSKLAALRVLEIEGAGLPRAQTLALKGGADPEEMPLELYTGYAEDGSAIELDLQRAGLATLEAVPEVNLVAMPALVSRIDHPASDDRKLEEVAAVAAAQRQLLGHCQRMGERFALLDTPRAFTPEQAVTFRNGLLEGVLPRYGALYYPWLRIALEAGPELLPPSGVVAGLIARSDRQDGVGRAPANLQIKGAVGFETELDETSEGDLCVAGVNPMRRLEEGALRLWGARCLSQERGYEYVHQRRVILYVLKALGTGLRWAIFEPNSPALRQRIKGSIEALLRGLLARGMAQGVKAEDAFYVKVDDELNDQNSAEAGQVIAELGIALTKPAEFILISVKRTPDTLSAVEEET